MGHLFPFSVLPRAWRRLIALQALSCRVLKCLLRIILTMQITPPPSGAVNPESQHQRPQTLEATNIDRTLNNNDWRNHFWGGFQQIQTHSIDQETNGVRSRNLRAKVMRLITPNPKNYARRQGYAKLLRFPNKQWLGAPLETPDSAPQATHNGSWGPVKIWDFLQLNGCRMPIVFQE